MNGWVIPAPAPWAKTKHAFAPDGRDKSAETVCVAPTFAFRRCGLTMFIAAFHDCRRRLRAMMLHADNTCNATAGAKAAVNLPILGGRK
jgi:hypothetical protein